jgi:hypothetical protein
MDPVGGTGGVTWAACGMGGWVGRWVVAVGLMGGKLVHIGMPVGDAAGRMTAGTAAG